MDPAAPFHRKPTGFIRPAPERQIWQNLSVHDVPLHLFLLQQMFQRVPAQGGQTVHIIWISTIELPIPWQHAEQPRQSSHPAFTISSRLYSFPSEISAIVTLRSISTSLFLPQSDLKSPTNVPDPPLWSPSSSQNGQRCDPRHTAPRSSRNLFFNLLHPVIFQDHKLLVGRGLTENV